MRACYCIRKGNIQCQIKEVLGHQYKLIRSTPYTRNNTERCEDTPWRIHDCSSQETSLLRHIRYYGNNQWISISHRIILLILKLTFIIVRLNHYFICYVWWGLFQLKYDNLVSNIYECKLILWKVRKNIDNKIHLHT
jgi:hypothetical protein